MYGGLFVAGGTGVVVFRGILNKKNMKSQAAKAKRIAAVSVALVAVALILIVMLLYATGEAPVEEVKDICASAITAFLISIVLFFVPVPDRMFLNQCHITLEIEPDRLGCDRPYHGAPYVTMPVKDVKRVLDYGECYYIIYTDMGQAIICQKDLLREGTLEEFEEIFAGKIKRRGRAKKQCKAEQKAERKK